MVTWNFSLHHQHYHGYHQPSTSQNRLVFLLTVSEVGLQTFVQLAWMMNLVQVLNQNRLFLRNPWYRLSMDNSTVYFYLEKIW